MQQEVAHEPATAGYGAIPGGVLSSSHAAEILTCSTGSASAIFV